MLLSSGGTSYNLDVISPELPRAGYIKRICREVTAQPINQNYVTRGMALSRYNNF